MDMNIKEDVVKLLATVTSEQRLRVGSRLPRYLPHIAEKHRREMFERDGAYRIGQMMIQKAEWEKLFALPTDDDRCRSDEMIDEWSCGFVVMTEPQFKALTEMVMTLVRQRELEAPL